MKQSYGAVIRCHPNKQSVTAQISQRIVRKAREQHVSVSEIDAYSMQLEPLFSRRDYEDYASGLPYEGCHEFHDHLSRISVIVFVFPIWMYSVPAQLKTVLERTFRPQLTFALNGGSVNPLLRNIRSCLVVTTSGQTSTLESVANDPVSGIFRNLAAQNFGPRAIYERLNLGGLDSRRFNPRTDFEAIENTLTKIIKYATSD